MALPVTLTSYFLPSSGNFRIKPILHGSNVYIVMMDTTTQIAILKATDPTSSFTEVANWTQSNQVHAISAIVNPNNTDEIIVNVMEGSAAKDESERRFDMATDSWVAAMTENSSGSYNGGSTFGSSNTARSDGDSIHCYRRNDDKIMGISYRRIAYTRNEGGSFTYLTDIDDAGEIAYPDCKSVTDDADRSYLFYQRGDTDHIYKKDLDSSNTLGSAVQVSDNIAFAISNGTPSGDGIVSEPVFYLSGSTKRVVVGWMRDSDSKIYTAKIDDNGTPDAEEVASAAAVLRSSNRVVADMAVDGTKVYLVYAKSADNDLFYLTNDDDGGWTGETSLLASIDCEYVGCEIYTRSGSKVLAYLYEDAGSWKYNELDISDAAAQPPDDRWHRVHAGLLAQ